MTAQGVIASEPGRNRMGDLLGGLAAMLVALPSAVAFGLIVFGPLGSEFVAAGATAGIIGSMVLGIVAPVLGGTPRLISAPCAPAAAVLGAFTAGLAAQNPQQAAALLIPVCLVAGFIQMVFGLARGGRLVKFIPYPVVGGYLSSVGLLIIKGQLPKFLGFPARDWTSLWTGLTQPSAWNGISMTVGLVAAVLMILTVTVTKKVPAPIVALIGATAAYFLCGAFRPELLTLEGNKLVIGKLAGGVGGLITHVGNLWSSLSSVSYDSLRAAFSTMLALAVLLSVDTLKTCIIVDALTKTRHNSNRELAGQGVANMLCAASGGIAGAGTMGPTLINITSGGQTRISGLMAGLFAAAAFFVLGPLVAWIPTPALAGILLVVGFRMIDRNSVKLLRQKSTALDFFVMLAVVATALTTDLIKAAGVGIGLAILLFIREQIRSSIVRRRLTAAEKFSKKQRLPVEIEILTRRGSETGIFELQGSLFFGTTDKLMSEIELHIKDKKNIVLDMRRVQAVDFSAAHLLSTLAARMSERHGRLIFAQLPNSLPTGQKLEEYFRATGVVDEKHGALVFPALDEALEWLEDRVLDEEAAAGDRSRLMDLREFEIFSAMPTELCSILAKCARPRSFGTGEYVFKQGETGDTFFVIRRGEVHIRLPLSAGGHHHLATFGRGDFFGDMSFLDRGTRSADALSSGNTEVFEISRSAFDEASNREPKMGWLVFSGLSRVLAIRLRHTNSELRALADA